MHGLSFTKNKFLYKNRTKFVMILIFVLALFVRFYSFKDSVYFGFDTARDAYYSQEIFLKGDIKLIGPPVSGDIGLNHGPLFWYLVGPMYVLGDGNPEIVSVIFRVINALGVFLIFFISYLLFSRSVGLIAALIYAVSFEESQYSFYVANPGLGALTIPLIFLGAVLIYKKNKYQKLGPVFMIGAAGLSAQLNIMFFYSFLVVLALLFLLRHQFKLVSGKYWLLGGATAGVFLSTYIISELRYGMRSVYVAFKLFKNGFGIVDTGTSSMELYFDKFLRMFKDNIVGIDNRTALVLVGSFIVAMVLFNALNDTAYRLLAIWLFAWVFLALIVSHNAYYTNAGLGMAVIISGALLIERLAKRNILIAIFAIFLIVSGNLNLVFRQSPKSLIYELITQPMMKLSDEKKLIDQMYSEAQGNGFTIRATGIPYKVQTLWAYLFEQYGKKKYGYVPYWETGNVIGFPGELPEVQKGTTCVRYLITEPSRGLPQELIVNDLSVEDYFSEVVATTKYGDFSLQSRRSKDKKCHNMIPNLI